MATSTKSSRFFPITLLALVRAAGGLALVACSSDDTTASDSATSGTADAGSSTKTDAAPSSTGTDDTSDAGTDGAPTTTATDSGPQSFSVGGSVSGLAGTGLALTLNGGQELAIAASGTFTFPTALVDGTAFEVAVKAQPGTPAQTCAVTNGAGTLAGAAVSNVTVTCTTNTYAIGGNVAHLSGANLVLTNNGGDDLPVTANGAFTFATKIASGATYAVAVKTQPSDDQVCAVTDGAGTVGAADVTNVAIACATRVCATAGEGNSLTVTCPEGTTIASVDFASYGTPTGTCGSFAEAQACAATTSLDVVKAACLGQNACAVAATNGTFGDPCVGTYKSLDVQVTCK